MDATNATGTLTGFLAGVIITVLSAIVVIPGSGAGGVPVAGSQSASATGGDGSSGGGGGDATGLFGSGGADGGGSAADSTTGSADASGEGQSAAGVGTTSGDATSGGTTGGTTSGGTSTTGGTTSGDGTTTASGDGGGTTSSGDDGGTTSGDTTSSGDDEGTTSGGTTSGGTTSGGTTTSGGDDGGTTSGGTTSGGDSGGDGGGSELACQPGSNGGSTDTGVTGDSIKLGATVAESGVGASFLGEARIAMNAVKNKVNRAGGICGRFVEVKYVDDGWDPQRGFEAIKSLVEAEGVFALAVVPSSEGLNLASENDYFERKQVPVVGSDGMIRTQYTDPYIFPVAASTVTTMHVMAKHAWDNGARELGLVFEKTYRFGVEGAYAFNQAHKRLTGGQDIKGYEDPFGNPTCGSGTRFCAIQAANESGGDYGGVARNFNNGCDDCDFVAYLMEPTSAETWFNTADAREPSHYAGNSPADFGAAAAQPLFTEDFATKCGDTCDGLLMWTGYNPPISPYDTQDGVRRYVDDLEQENASADPNNQFTEGAYLGMAAMVEGLARTGPNLTRNRLMDTLHGMELQIGLSPTLSWDEGNHFANPAAQAFQVQARNGFSGWTHAQDYINDPWLGQDVGS